MLVRQLSAAYNSADRIYSSIWHDYRRKYVDVLPVQNIQIFCLHFFEHIVCLPSLSNYVCVWSCATQNWHYFIILWSIEPIRPNSIHIWMHNLFFCNLIHHRIIKWLLWCNLSECFYVYKYNHFVWPQIDFVHSAIKWFCCTNSIWFLDSVVLDSSKICCSQHQLAHLPI